MSHDRIKYVPITDHRFELDFLFHIEYRPNIFQFQFRKFCAINSYCDQVKEYPFITTPSERNQLSFVSQ